MDARIGIHEVDDGLQLGLSRIGRQHEAAHGNAMEIGLAGAGALVGQIVGPLPHAHNGERRCHAVRPQAVDARQQALP